MSQWAAILPKLAGGELSGAGSEPLFKLGLVHFDWSEHFTLPSSAKASVRPGDYGILEIVSNVREFCRKLIIIDSAGTLVSPYGWPLNQNVHLGKHMAMPSSPVLSLQ